MPEIIDPVIRSFCMTENERFGLVFVKTGSINSGTGVWIPIIPIRRPSQLNRRDYSENRRTNTKQRSLGKEVEALAYIQLFSWAQDRLLIYAVFFCDRGKGDRPAKDKY